MEILAQAEVTVEVPGPPECVASNRPEAGGRCKLWGRKAWGLLGGTCRWDRPDRLRQHRSAGRGRHVVGKQSVGRGSVHDAEWKARVIKKSAGNGPARNGAVYELALIFKWQLPYVASGQVMAQIVVGWTVIKPSIERADLVCETAIEQVISQDSAIGDVIQSVAVSVVDSARQPLPHILLNRESDAVVVRNSPIRQLVHIGDS